MSERPPYRIELERKLDGFTATLPSQPVDALRLLGALCVMVLAIALIPAALIAAVAAGVFGAVQALVAVGVSHEALELAAVLMALPVFGFVLLAGLTLCQRAMLYGMWFVSGALDRFCATLALRGQRLEISSWRGRRSLLLSDGVQASVRHGWLCIEDRSGRTSRLWTGRAAARWLAAELNAARQSALVGTEAEIPAAVAALRARLS